MNIGTAQEQPHTGGWERMESAPRDGTVIVCIYDNDCGWEYRVVAWVDDADYPWGDVGDPEGNAWPEDRMCFWTKVRPGLPLPPPPYDHAA